MSVNSHQIMVFPASFGQEQLWFLNALNQKSQLAYTMAVCVTITGDLDILRLQHAINSIVASQEILRTSFSYTHGELNQVVSRSTTLPIHIIDYLNDQKEIQRLINTEIKREWSLEQAPLYRLLLVKTGKKSYEFIVSAHHIVCDGISLQLLLKRVFSAYETRSYESVVADDSELQFADYAAWNKRSHHSDIAYQLDYWKLKLAGAQTVLEIAPLTQRYSQQSFNGARIPLVFDHSEWQDMRQTCSQIGVSTAAVFLAAYCVILHRMAEQEDILIGVPTSNRMRPELSNIIGYLSNICAFRSQYYEEQSIATYLQHVQQTLSNLIEHGEASLTEVLRCVEHVRLPGVNPLFQVLFGYEQDTQRSLDVDSLHLEFSDIDTGAARLDLSLFLFEDQEQNVSGFLEYATDILDAATAKQIALMLEIVLRQFIASPSLSLGELQFGGQESVAVADSLKPEFDSIPTRLGELAERQPDTIALCDERMELTFCSLQQHILNTAGVLHSHGIKPGSFVAVMGGRGVPWVVTMLAIWHVGAIYIPLDIDMPEQRLRDILSSLHGVMLVADDRVPETFRDSSTIDLKTLLVPTGQQAVIPAADSATAGYIMFTSGSTGRPKAVQIGQDNLIAALCAFGKLLNIDSDDRMLALTTFSFDISLLELLMTLVHGGSVYIASVETQRDGRKLAACLSDGKVTFAQATPVSWSMALQAGWSPRPSLTMFCGGELLPQDLADQLCQSGSTLWNLYGPTETTIWSTAYCVQQGGKVRLGEPIPGTQVAVVDKNFHPVPRGFTGELVIAGMGVSKGYYGNAAETAKKFLPDLFSEGSRAYLTGDMVRMLPDGLLDYIGRSDDQIKLHGHRIELGEIEVALRTLSGVEDAAARLFVQGDSACLQAFIVLTADVDDEKIWMTHTFESLKQSLPEAYLPTEYYRIPEIPLTSNGKRDKKRLGFHATRIAAARDSTPPRNETEAKVYEIWCRLLGIEHFGITDDFFQIGGHSILVARMVESIEATFGQHVPIADIYVAPTIARIAATLDSMKFDAGADSQTVKGDWEFKPISFIAVTQRSSHSQEK
ncbi:non-ribosomal peptide synthetase [Photorhabdus laumondii]|uniref:non-ribosomal peptide synthetase n=1 Tax=Photorhabdus laumondii TaxID=2218628 RepID=UPI003314CA56